MMLTDEEVMSATRAGLADELHTVVARDGLGRDVRRRVTRARMARRTGVAALALGAVAVAVPLTTQSTAPTGPTTAQGGGAVSSPRIELVGYAVNLPAGYRVTGTSAVGPNGEVVSASSEQDVPAARDAARYNAVVKRITWKGKDAFIVQSPDTIKLYVATTATPGAPAVATTTGDGIAIEGYVVVSGSTGVTERQLTSWLSDES